MKATQFSTDLAIFDAKIETFRGSIPRRCRGRPMALQSGSRLQHTKMTMLYGLCQL